MIPGAAYSGGVLLADGRVLFIPHNATTIAIFNPDTEKCEYHIAAGMTQCWGAHFGGVLLPDGRVALGPGNTKTIGIFNPKTSAYSKISCASDRFAFFGSHYSYNSFIPRNATDAWFVTLSDEKERARTQARAEAVKAELVAAAWHPKRMTEWCLDTDERRELAEMGLAA